MLNRQTQPKYLCIVSNLIYWRPSWSIKRDSKDLSGPVFRSVPKCINLPWNAWELWEMPTEYANKGKLESLNAARKETKPIFYLLGKILLTQEIKHTRNEILTPALGNSPNRKRLHPSLDLKSVVRKSHHCACLPHLMQRVPGSHQKYFSVLKQDSDLLEHYGSVR